MGSICGLEFAHQEGRASGCSAADHLCEWQEHRDNPREKNSSGTEDNKRTEAMAAMVPMDVLIDILKRLPGKSLMRFKAVCKLWLSLITDPAFAELHHINTTRFSGGSGGGLLLLPPRDCGSPLCVVDLKKEPSERTSVLEPFLPYGMSAMSNVVDGLICFYEQRSMYLYNLTTRESLRLPPAKLTLSWDSFMRRCFLTFDPKKKEFKVLLFQHPYSYRRVETVECQVLTVGGKDGGWRSIDISYIDTRFTSLTERRRSHGVCVDGVLYWSVERGIVAFDVAGEKLEVIDLPEVTIYNRPTIAEARGRVSLFSIEITEERCGSIKVTWWRLRERSLKDGPLWTRNVITYQFPFFRPLQWIRCTSLGQVFSVRNPESDECIIDCYDLVTGGREVFEVNNAKGILYSTHERFRPMRFSENIFPLTNNKENT